MDYSFAVPKNRRHNLLGGPGGFESSEKWHVSIPSIPVYSPDHNDTARFHHRLQL